MQTNRLDGNNAERREELRVSYVGEPTVGDGGGMWKSVPSTGEYLNWRERPCVGRYV
jgi:hypothetical protein